jgi:16S rRNA (adenine1518-N6/adenine1519-N6)-dimethyltransferase
MNRSLLVEAKKSLGQNFLVDPNLAVKLVQALAAPPAEPVLEIGPGTGALTEHLLAPGRTLIAVEIDGRLIPELRSRFGEQVRLMHADILEVDLTALAREHGQRLAVIGNLPYYASSPILFHLLAHRAAISHAVLVLQSEVVDRVCATPGGKEYGSLTVQLALYAARQRLFKLPAAVFRPRPQIDSTAMLLDFTQPLAIQPRDAHALEVILRAAFGQRRKTLRNAIGAVLGVSLAEQVLHAAGIDVQQRAEQLAPEDFVRLADRWRELKPNVE